MYVTMKSARDRAPRVSPGDILDKRVNGSFKSAPDELVQPFKTWAKRAYKDFKPTTLSPKLRRIVHGR